MGFQEEVLRRLDEHRALLEEHDRLITKKGETQMSDGTDSLELDLQNKKVKMTGNDIFTMVSTLGVVGLIVMSWYHYDDSKTGRAEFIAVMRQQVIATNEATRAQKFANCLNGFPEGERQMRKSVCEEATR